jgi:hypothetical protein
MSMLPLPRPSCIVTENHGVGGSIPPLAPHSVSWLRMIAHLCALFRSNCTSGCTRKAKSVSFSYAVESVRFSTIYLGLPRPSSNERHKYSPSTPSMIICAPPSSKTITIKEDQP